MKVALLIVGMSYEKNKGTDFRHCYHNIKTTLIDYLKKDNTLSIHLCTYQSEFSEELSIYKYDSLNIVPFENSNQVTTRKLGLKSIKNLDVDFFILSRFDVHYNLKLCEVNVDYNKVNFVSREGDGYWNSSKFTCDTFYIIPKKFIDAFIFSLEDLENFPTRPFCVDMHGLYPILSSKIGEKNINFMMEGENQLSGNLFNSVCRKTRLTANFYVSPEVLTRNFEE